MDAPHPTGGRRLLRDGRQGFGGIVPWAAASALLQSPTARQYNALMTPTLTVQLPEPLYQRLADRARRANRPVEAELLELVAAAVPDERADTTTDLQLLDDAAPWRAACGRLAAAARSRLEGPEHARQ